MALDISLVPNTLLEILLLLGVFGVLIFSAVHVAEYIHKWRVMRRRIARARRFQRALRKKTDRIDARKQAIVEAQKKAEDERKVQNLKAELEVQVRTQVEEQLKTEKEKLAQLEKSLEEQKSKPVAKAREEITTEPALLQYLFKKYVYNSEYALDLTDADLVDTPSVLQTLFRKYIYNNAYTCFEEQEDRAQKYSERVRPLTRPYPNVPQGTPSGVYREKELFMRDTMYSNETRPSQTHRDNETRFQAPRKDCERIQSEINKLAERHRNDDIWYNEFGDQVDHNGTMVQI